MVSKTYDQKTSDRIEKGKELFERGCVSTRGTLEYQVESLDGERAYHVEFDHGWRCNCPDFEQRKIDCKHIHAVHFFREEWEPKIANDENQVSTILKAHLAQAVDRVVASNCNNYEVTVKNIYFDPTNKTKILVEMQIDGMVL